MLNISKIILIGSTGQLGSDIKELFEKKNEIICLDIDEFQVENKELVNEVIPSHEPDFVINTAAFHNVGECEKNPQQAFLINSTAVKYLADICNEIDSTLIHFSTDYVYGLDKSRNKPYTEDDISGPVQIYGISKLAGEKILEMYSKKYFCFRISGLYGIKGTIAKKYPNFVEMMITLGRNAEEKNEKMASAKDQVLTFNSTTEISKVVQKAIETTEYGLYHSTCEGYCSRLEFVKTIFELESINVELYGVDSDFFKPTYAQPTFSALENEKLKKLGITMPHWKDALKAYLKERKN